MANDFSVTADIGTLRDPAEPPQQRQCNTQLWAPQLQHTCPFPAQPSARSTQSLHASIDYAQEPRAVKVLRGKATFLGVVLVVCVRRNLVVVVVAVAAAVAC